MSKTETVKRGYYLNFAEELKPDEVSALGDRIEFHLGFMAICMGSGRTEEAQNQLAKLLDIAKNMKGKAGYQL
jgi:hypothetical protein